MIALIGSWAANFQYPSFRESPTDVDVVGSYDELIAFGKSFGQLKSCYPINEGKTLVMKAANGTIIEGSIAWEDSLAADFLETLSIDSYSRQADFNGTTVIIPSINVLYMLKMSHRYLKNSPSFLKTMQDIHEMRRRWNASIPGYWEEHYKRRMKEQYSYAHPKLNVSKTDFFNGDGVDYKYDHDTIHEAVKHLDRPAYTYFKPEDSAVMVSREMWNNLDESIKLYSVLEEAYVLALERSQIPYPQMAPFESFKIAMMKVCTSITSGWWREYAWENYGKVMQMYSDTYLAKFKQGVKDGVVKPYDPNKGIY